MKRTHKKFAAVIAGAALLAAGASMTAYAASGWQEENGVWVYLDKNGGYVTDAWKKSDGQFYYLNDSGEMAVDTLVEYNGDVYYVDEDGVQARNKWVSFASSNEAADVWYYFGAAGKACTGGKRTINGRKYIFDDDGRMLTGWQQYGDKDYWYYLGTENEGWAHTGWQCLEPAEDMDGDYDGEEWFFLKLSTGAAYRDGRKQINGRYYTFDENGVMQDKWLIGTPAAPDYSEVGGASRSSAYYREDGSQGKGWVYTYAPDDTNEDSDKEWYYLDKNGVPFNENGKDSYIYTGETGLSGTALEQMGIMWNGENPLTHVAAKVIDDNTYLFDNNGKLLTGLYYLTEVSRAGSSSDLGVFNQTAVDGIEYRTGAFYYFCEEEGSLEGRMMTGKQAVEYDGELYYYYFRKDGAAYTNIIADGYLYGPDGARMESYDEYRKVPVTPKESIYEKGNRKSHSDCVMILNKNGKVKKSGTVKFDGVKYTIENYEVIEEEEID